ncbi:MAG: hypothetical protein ABIF11_10285 [Nitrospirota bacterium]
MDKLIIEKLLSIAVLGYCRIFWNNDKVELKPNFRAKVSATTHRLYKKVLQALRLKTK